MIFHGTQASSEVEGYSEVVVRDDAVVVEAVVVKDLFSPSRQLLCAHCQYFFRSAFKLGPIKCPENILQCSASISNSC